MNFLALLGWSYDDKTTIMSPRRARRALLARARRREPGDLRLREARLDERRLPARAAARRLRRRGSSPTCASGAYDWDEELVRRAAPLVQEKIETLGRVPRVRCASSSSRSSPTDGFDDGRRMLGAAAEALDGRAVRGGADREGAARRRRRARAEAAAGVPADPPRGHGLEGLARPLREPRAARPRRVARADQARGRRSGLGARQRVERALERVPGAQPELGLDRGSSSGTGPVGGLVQLLRVGSICHLQRINGRERAEDTATLLSDSAGAAA